MPDYNNAWSRRQQDLEARSCLHERLDYFLSQNNVQKTAMPKLFWIAFIAAVSMSVPAGFVGVNDVSAAEAKYRSISQAVNEDFVINLNKKVRSIATSDIVFAPAVKGSWFIVRESAISPDKLVFRPTDGFQAKTQYKISNIKLNKLVFGSENLDNIDFITEPAEGINDYGTMLLEDGSVLPADYVFDFSLRYQRNLDLKTTPEIELVKDITDGKNYKWATKGYLPQGQKVKIELFDIDTEKVLISRSFVVASEPVISFNKINYFGVDDTAQITFSEPMKNPSSDAIGFSVTGEGSWVSNKVYSFSPKNITAGSRYTYKIKAGQRTESGGVLTKDYDGEFFTTGAVKVLASSPSGSELSQASQLLSFEFDQSVDHASAIQHFSVNAGTVASSYWKDNTIFIKLVNIGYQKKVTATILTGVKNAGFGLPSLSAFSANFTTEARVVQYNVPFYHQQHSATCAVASLRMLLAYKGVYTSEEDIINKIGYNPRAIDRSTNPAKWDDPNEMFVGYMDGTSSDTAAGPDAMPLVKTAIAYGRNASMATNISVDWVASHIQQGYPVIVFGANSTAAGYNSWVTPTGKTIRMNNSSHTVVVTGVKGDVGSLVGFWVSNSTTYSAQFWTAARLQSFIAQDTYGQAVKVE